MCFDYWERALDTDLHSLLHAVQATEIAPIHAKELEPANAHPVSNCASNDVFRPA